ncbi:MAG: Trm112 family protein [Candidatus Omnitrophica bacterium]|nr:Trm112 family protein [Candidatus Omnitrophota bacterium]
MNEELLKILACPKCKGKVIWKEDRIICPKCKKYYPLKEGIPVMLIEEARDYEEKNE